MDVQCIIFDCHYAIELSEEDQERDNPKMRSSFVFLPLMVISVIFVLNGAKSLPVGTRKNQNPVSGNMCEKPVVCNYCNYYNQEPNSHASEAIMELKTKIEQVIALVNKTSLPTTTNPPAIPVSSCKEQYEKDRSSMSQVYTLKFASQKIPVYCHMGKFGCGDGGWTLAMKIDGTKRTFHYDSQLWSNRATYNLPGGKTGFDAQETKLPSYWNTPFSKICLGMKIGHQIGFLIVYKQANSLYSLIADGNYRATSLGRNMWKTLIGSQASLQLNCNKEGFNVKPVSKSDSRARIGFIGNQQNDCIGSESRIAFGGAGTPDDSNTCGNEAVNSPDNGDKHMKALGYILVQ